jgi:CMP-N,N'-diacetyllegionaminic acid synthase
MKIFVDIDETICNVGGNKYTPRDYSGALPIKKNIEAVNRLYDEGHHITYWTARGSLSGTDWYDITKQQLTEWGAQHHNLILGKPAYDLYIDDKSINTAAWEKMGRCIPEQL